MRMAPVAALPDTPSMEHSIRPGTTLRGRRIVVTGASDGIGLAIARGVAARGGALVLPVRDRAKGDRVARAIRTAVPGAEVTLADLDLASLASVRAFAAAMRTDGRPLHGLVNNAGIVVMDPPERRLSEDGHELHFQTNHLGHFALVAQLLPLLVAGHGRVVAQTSLAVRMRPIDPDAMRSADGYSGFRAYASSKLAIALFVAEFQRRSVAGGWGVGAATAHPGIVATNILAGGIPGRAGRITPVLRQLVQDTDGGALPALCALTEPELRPGIVYAPSGMFQFRGAARPVRSPGRALDPLAAARVWAMSEELAGVRFPAVAAPSVSGVLH